MFLSWIRYHGRSAALSEALGLPAVWLPREGPAPWAYLKNAARTFREVRQRRPAVIGLMLPPLPALIAVLLAHPRRTKVLADLHSGVFLNPRWRWCLGITLHLLARGHCAVVTNEELAAVCRGAGVRTFVLHDLLTAPAGQAPSRTPSAGTRSLIVVPLSYANDEPVEQILQAATLLPDVQFALTGDAPARFRARALQNLSFTGRLDFASYTALLRSSDAVLALTTRDLTMQRAGYEALQAGVPVITSAFTPLRRYFGSAAVFTEPTPHAISDAVQTALRDNELLRARAGEVLRERLVDQATAFNELEAWVAAQSGERVA